MSPQMMPVASGRGVDICSPEAGKFSFSKSPFAAHMTMSAVDIYPGGDFGDTAPSPVEGTVIDAREYRTPTPFRERDFMEYVTAIRQGDSVVKILHMKPTVEVGDTVSVGDPLGTLIHNGYFYYWNEAPLHVEVRAVDDYIRASNDNPLTAAFHFPKSAAGSQGLYSDIQCKVVYADERYALLKGGYTGDKVKGYSVGPWLLDGLVPAIPLKDIDYFGLIGDTAPPSYIRSAGNRYMVSTGSVEASVHSGGAVDCLGLGFTLTRRIPTIKVIPRRYGQKLFDVGDDVTIRISLFREQEE